MYVRPMDGSEIANELNVLGKQYLMFLNEL